MRRRLVARWYAFVLNENVPTWQLYARRLGVPLVLGGALGVLLAFILAQISAPARWWVLIALLLFAFVWCWRQLRWVTEQKQLIKRDQERFEALMRAGRRKRGDDE